MAWDASRPIPWNRLLRDWVMYAVIMAIVFALVARDRLVVSLVAVVVSLPAYLAIGGTLAKFGYVRKTMAEQRAIADRRRAERQADKDGRAGTGAGAGSRNRPAPTRRTSTGPSQRPRRTNKTRKR